ncbi:TonB-dependent siderophore receptor [Kovacikia minuta CCNUW1]|uniref:TonB-dependent siderophore receptor n=1 Tax=Kovacikia minuta TaxID=2931930 RepID=UPI001CCF4BD0|nr:TonB-dependent siderophore receptor [Kovacikia minuta]UBF26358.1 TonB-dependent siderophore receptor [Kovacikia minuta CCNUW1]
MSRWFRWAIAGGDRFLMAISLAGCKEIFVSKWHLRLGMVAVGAIFVGSLPQPDSAEIAQAEEPPRKRNWQNVTTTELPRIKDLKRSAKTLKDWLAQMQEPAVEAPIQVTGVQLNRTEFGLEIGLETEAGKPLQIDATKFRVEGNSLVADIPNAVLALPNVQEFNADKPTGEIANVRVRQMDATRIRVTVTGNHALPTEEVSLKTGELTYSLNPEGEVPEEELVVTGTGQRGYFIPDATTATRTDTPLRDIPQSIQVVPRQVIEDQKILRISDAVRNVSGVTPQGGYSGLTDNYNIRGFTTYDNLRDGYYAQDNLVNPTNIERIEVLKGPASVLYGQFEPGGVVNYVTKKPLSEPYYFAEFTAGSFSTYRPSIDLSGPLNTDKTLLYRLNAAYESSGSFIDFVDQKQFSIAPSLTYKIGDATSLTLQYEYLNADRTYYDGLPPDPSVFKAPISRFLGEPGDRFKFESHTIFLALNHRFNENLRLRSAFTTELRDTEEPGEFRPNSIAADGRTVLRRYAAGPGYYRNDALQNDLISNFNTGAIQHQLLLGLEWNQYTYGYDYLRSSVDLTPSIDLFNPVYGASPPPIFDEASQRDRFHRTTIGLYAQDQITLLPNLKLLVGGRYDFIHRKNRSQPLDASGNDPIGDATEERLYNGAFSPRVGIVYQPIPPISLYASYSRSFNPSGSRTVDGSLLPPERGTQYEVGIRGETLNGKLSATLSAYEIIKANVATVDTNNTDFSIAAGEVKSRGIEFDVVGEILPGWNVIASAFVNDAFVSRDNSLPVGDRLVNAPSQGASLWTTYEIQRGSLKGLGFGAGVFFVGDREAELPNTFEIPSYVRADSAVYYKRDRWKVGLNFKNLTSTQYYESQGYYLRPGAPFSVLGTVSVNF